MKSSPKVSTISSAKQGGQLIAELTYRIDTSGNSKDTVYSIMFRNAEYKSIIDYKSVVFNGEGSTLTDLYTL